MNLANILPNNKIVGGMNAKGILRGKLSKGFGRINIIDNSVEVIEFDIDSKNNV